MTTVSELQTEWKHCTRCGLSKSATFHVMGRGTLPCDILFIGEGPGRAEDVIGEAFVGPAGKLLNRALPAGDARPIYFMNLVACRPCNGYSEPNRPPLPPEIEACKPRFLSLLELAKPKGVIVCGRLPQKVWMATTETATIGCQILFIPHPSAILRRGGEASEAWGKYKGSIADFFRRIK